MAKNQKKESAQKIANTPAPGQKRFLPYGPDILPFIFCLLYFAVEFFPGFGGVDDMGTQWFYMVVLDFVAAIYILDKKNDFDFPAASILKSTFAKLYLSLFVLAGISVFFSINHTEGWVCYVRFIATIIAFFNLAILLYGRIHLFRILSQVLAIIVLFESVEILYQFFSQMSNYRLTELILSLKGRAGNKNILAAALVVKIPFVLYGIYSSRLFGKILNIAILFVTVLSILLINSRTTYLALLVELIIYLAFCFQQYLKGRNKQENLFRAGYLVITITAAFFVSLVAVSAAKSSFQDDSSDANQYGTVTERLVSVTSAADESNQQRLFLWHNAFDYFKEHVWMGCGYGNWKIASIPYIKYLVNDLSVPIHAHNDFLEYFAELGIAGGLLFISLFICLTAYTIKILAADANEDIKLISVFSFIALAAYAVDALFNFPGERPVNQLFFVFITALGVMAFRAKKDVETEPGARKQTSNLAKSVFAFLAILLLLPSAYITFLTYQSLVVQNRVIADLNNEPLKLPLSDVINAFPPIPNITSSAQPIDAIIGRYLYENKRYKEAIVYLDKGAKANPYIMYSEFLKADVYYADNQMDSAYRYATLAYFTKPRAKTYYQTLIAVSAKMGDSTSIMKAFSLFSKFRPNEQIGWNLYLMGMLNVKMNTGPKRSTPQLLAIADSALRLFPGDKELLTRRSEIFTNLPANTVSKQVIQGNDVILANQYFTDATASFNKGDYADAAKKFIKSSQISTGSYGVYENIAICYFNMKQWEQSLPYFDKVLSMKTATDGKSEYFKGAALINLGRKDEACSLLKIAKAKNYTAADGLITTYCK